MQLRLEDVDMKTWVESKLKELTVEEKALLLSGVDVWRTYPIKRLGIPQLKVFLPVVYCVNPNCEGCANN
jgi:hypothetical protein